MTSFLTDKEKKEVFKELQKAVVGPERRTLFERTSLEDPLPGGRFAAARKADQIAKAQINGSSPTVEYPRIPTPWDGTPNHEETYDASADCGNVFDGTLTRGHPDVDNLASEAPPPSSCSVGGDEGQSAPETQPLSVEATGPQSSFDDRGRV